MSVTRPAGQCAAARLSRRPRTRLSSTPISPTPVLPSTSRSTMCEPISPAPPVTSDRCRTSRCVMPQLGPMCATCAVERRPRRSTLSARVISGNSGSESTRRQRARRPGSRPARSRGRRRPSAGAPGSGSGARSGRRAPPVALQRVALGVRTTNRCQTWRASAGRRRQRRATAGQQVGRTRGERAAGLGPAPPGVELDAEHGALDGVHAVVEARSSWWYAALGASRAASRTVRAHVGVVGDDRAALAVGAEVLAGVEAEAADVPRLPTAGPGTRRRAPGRRPRSRGCRGARRSPAAGPCRPAGRTGGPAGSPWSAA